ncbi:MAG: hypothetical protein ACREBG_06215 [Pyrinomonadaceae bacterium]
MTNKAEATKVTESGETKLGATELTEAAKRNFIEPELTVPVDILEATTFFNGISSGATN